VIIRLPAVAFAGVLFAVPLLTAPIRPVIVPGLIGLLLATVGIVTLWRWPATAAACMFLTEYAAALWIAGVPASVVGAAAFGLSLLFLLQAVELARCLRHAAARGTGVVRSQLTWWMGFGAATLAATLLVMALAGTLAASVPFAAAPFVTAAGALGVVLALAAAVRGATRDAPP
jgi:hypothetical protein